MAEDIINDLKLNNQRAIAHLLRGGTLPHHGNILNICFVKFHPLLIKLWLRMEN